MVRLRRAACRDGQTNRISPAVDNAVKLRGAFRDISGALPMRVEGNVKCDQCQWRNLNEKYCLKELIYDTSSIALYIYVEEIGYQEL